MVLSLSKLIRYQWLFAALAVGFLLASWFAKATTGAPLSAANIPASIALFALYAGALMLPSMGRIGLYRLAMLPALLFFGGGGVVANILRYLNGGADQYAGFLVFCIAVGINAFGTALNLIAVFGAYAQADDAPA